MKIKMKRYEHLAVLHAKQYKNWDYQIIAKSAYLAGVKECDDQADYYNELIEVEFKDGEHQLIDDIKIKSEIV